MDNYQISETFSLLSKLIDIHGENSFKAKSYASAAFAIDKLSVKLSEIPIDQIASLNGIGTSSAQKIAELLQNGKINYLEEMIEKTPSGVIEMLKIKGIGPKKINTIWKEMGIESVGELLYACKENRLKLYKGFGEKTQQNVIDTIEFYFKNKGSHLYAQVDVIANEVSSFIKNIFPQSRIIQTGTFIRQLETIDELEFIIAEPIPQIELLMQAVEGFTLKEKISDGIRYTTQMGIDIVLHAANDNDLIEKSLKLTSSEAFWTALTNLTGHDTGGLLTEESYFEKMSIPYIEPFLRENPSILLQKNKEKGEILQLTDFKGIIHCHSNWSDGSNTIEELALAAIEKGLEYLVISDHSKSAFYAQGLSEEKIREQHRYIDELNAKLSPFRIFKSIEADILNDGSLDYSDGILKTFDLVIASVHSNLKMTEEKAMMRLLKAIENPFTTILGHMTGRLLLSRPGYPINHRKIIDACAAHHVVIELNANPSRLDMDWRHIEYALEKNVLLSINPDAHQISGFDDIEYGMKVAQKANVTKKQNLSSFSLTEFESFILNRNK